MVSSITFFTSIIATISKKVKLPNGSFAEVTHIRTVKISATFTLTNVVYVPSFSFNLISASKLTKNVKYCLTFLASFCSFFFFFGLLGVVRPPPWAWGWFDHPQTSRGAKNGVAKGWLLIFFLFFSIFIF